MGSPEALPCSLGRFISYVCGTEGRGERRGEVEGSRACMFEG